jgi:peptide/histidine transporter 3/4
MAPLYAALYIIAFGTGLVKPNTASLGGDQFDDSDPKERKQSVGFFAWFYFFANLGLLFAFTLGVYLQDNVSRSWGYGFSFMLYAVCFLIFLSGFKIFRHKVPSGSFLTRMAQVIVASARKWNAPLPEDPQGLYNPAVNQIKVKLGHTISLR